MTNIKQTIRKGMLTGLAGLLIGASLISGCQVPENKPKPKIQHQKLYNEKGERMSNGVTDKEYGKAKHITDEIENIFHYSPLARDLEEQRKGRIIRYLREKHMLEDSYWPLREDPARYGDDQSTMTKIYREKQWKFEDEQYNLNPEYKKNMDIQHKYLFLEEWVKSHK